MNELKDKAREFLIEKHGKRLFQIQSPVFDTRCVLAENVSHGFLIDCMAEFANEQVAELREKLLDKALEISDLNSEVKSLREKLAAVEEKRDMWLRIAQRLFKERQTMLHGHIYDLPTDDVVLEATILEDIINKENQ